MNSFSEHHFYLVLLAASGNYRKRAASLIPCKAFYLLYNSNKICPWLQKLISRYRLSSAASVKLRLTRNPAEMSSGMTQRVWKAMSKSQRRNRSLDCGIVRQHVDPFNGGRRSVRARRRRCRRRRRRPPRRRSLGRWSPHEERSCCRKSFFYTPSSITLTKEKLCSVRQNIKCP